MMIDCDSCVVRNIRCGDCVMNVLIEISEEREISAPTADALTTLAESGLVPPLRFVRDVSA